MIEKYVYSATLATLNAFLAQYESASTPVLSSGNYYALVRTSKNFAPYTGVSFCSKAIGKPICGEFFGAVSQPIRGTINVLDYGAVAVDDESYANLNDAAFADAIADLQHGQSFVVPDTGAPFLVSLPLVFAKGYIKIDGRGAIKAASTFTPSTAYLVSLIPTQLSAYNTFVYPIEVDNLLLNCNYACRGVYGWKLDHPILKNIRVERAYGRSFDFKRVREGCMILPQVIEGQERLAYATPSAWSSGTSYVANDRVRAVNAAWNSGTAYTMGQFCEYGGARWYCKAANTNNTPPTSHAYWISVPFDDYICVTANTNKNPFTYNQNNGTPADRLWQKTYQDEAAMEFDDNLLDGGDVTNSLHIYSPIIRDTGNRCYFRVDCNKPVATTGSISIHGCHIHDLVNTSTYASQLEGSKTGTMRRMIELGRTNLITFYGGIIRAIDNANSIALMVGDGSTTKQSINTALIGTSLSMGDGAASVCALVMPSITSQGGNTQLNCRFYGGGANSVKILDPNGYFNDLFTTSFGSLSGAYNEGHLLMGAYHIWVDDTGRLRIKSGVPSSSTDGTVVGTQS